MNWFPSPYNQTVKVAVLRRFQVKSGQESAFEAYLAELAAEPILNRAESSVVESVFTRKIDQHTYLYWLSIEKADNEALERCYASVVGPLLKCIELASYREFHPDQSMFEELKGPSTRHDEYLPGFVIASLVEAAPARPIF